MRENGEGMRKWRERFTLKISSFSVYFLPLCPFPISKIVKFCHKMLSTALLSQIPQKTSHTRYEKIILGRIRCEKAPLVVTAFGNSWWFSVGQECCDLVTAGGQKGLRRRNWEDWDEIGRKLQGKLGGMERE